MKTCIKCGSDKTYIVRSHHNNKPYPHWFKFNDGFICEKCYQRQIYNNSRQNYYLLTELEYAYEREQQLYE